MSQGHVASRPRLANPCKHPGPGFLLLQQPSPNPGLGLPRCSEGFHYEYRCQQRGDRAVLSKQGEEGERVVAYYSRALNRAERNYCVTQSELLVVEAVWYFWPCLNGSHFLIRTDHASLTWLLKARPAGSGDGSHHQADPAPRSTRRCYRCDEPGHLACNCPAPAPKARATQPGGNDNGVTGDRAAPQVG